MKKRISLLLIVAMVLSSIAVTPSEAKKVKKPKLSETIVRLNVGNDDMGDEEHIIIQNVKKNNIKKCTLTNTNTEPALYFASFPAGYDKRELHITAAQKNTGLEDSYDIVVTVNLLLKKKVAGKKKYKFTINVHVNIYGNSPDPTQAPVNTPMPTVAPNDNDKIKYISDREVLYYENEKVQKVFFSLKDNNENRLSGSGIAKIRFTNTNGETVFSKEVQFTKNNFGTWTDKNGVSKYLCSINIPISEIQKGSSPTGKMGLYVELDDGTYFDEKEFNINNLPIDMPIVTCIENPGGNLIYNRNWFILSNMHVSLDWAYDNTYKITVTGEVKHDPDRLGATEGYVKINCKVKERGSSAIVYSYQLLFKSIFPGEVYKINEYFSCDKLEPGKEYFLEFWDS